MKSQPLVEKKVIFLIIFVPGENKKKMTVHVEISTVFDYTCLMIKLTRAAVSLLILGLPLVFIPGGFSDFRLPKELFFQGIVAVLTVCWILFLTVFGLFKPLWKKLSRDGIFLVLLFFLGLSVFSLFFHGTYGVGKHQVVNLGLAIFLYAILRTTFKTEDIPFFVNLFLFSAVIVSLFTISQYREFSRADLLIYRKDATYSLLGNSNTVGAYLMGVVPVALAHLKSASSMIKRVLFLFALVIVSAGLIYSQAAAAYIGVGGGLLFFGFLIRRPGGWASMHYKVILASILVLMVIFNFTPVYDSVVFRIDNLLAGNYKRVLSNRWEVWQAGLWLFKQKPLLGYGMGGFPMNAPEGLGAHYAAHPDAPSHPHHIRHAHNDFLEKGVELGILGVGFMVFLLCLFFHRVWRAGRRYKKIRNPETGQTKAFHYAVGFGAGIFAFVINASANFPLHLAATGFQILFAAALGLIAVGGILNESGEERFIEAERQKPVPLFRPVWKWVIPVLLVFLIFVLFMDMRSRHMWNAHLGRGVRLLEAGLNARSTSAEKAGIFFRRSLNDLLKARDFFPGDGAQSYYLGIAYLSLRMGPEALEAFNTAERSYRRPELYYGRGQVLFYLFNDKEGAECDYKKALRLKPDFEIARKALERIN